MLRFGINFSSIIKYVVVSDSPLFQQSLKNKSSMVAVGNSDILDTFISNLTINKREKWRTNRKNNNQDGITTSEIDTMQSQITTTHHLTEDSIDEYILKHFNSPNLTTILNECLEKRIQLSQNTMTKLAYNWARNGNKSGIDQLIFMMMRCDEQIERRELERYRIYQAEALWRSGASAEKSLIILAEVYRDQPALRRHVRSSLRPLLAEVIKSRGEASLMQAKKVVLLLSASPFDDPIPLSFLWGRCILSDCFADQQMATELLEIGRINPLFKRAIGSRVDPILGEALANHQIDAVYRLLEALLYLSMPKHSQVTLGKLFDYKYLMGDLAGCKAVLKSCDELELDVGYTRRNQFEAMQAKISSGKSLFSGSNYQTKVNKYENPKPVPKFRLKL